MEILKSGIIYRPDEGPFKYQAWPTVCKDENGILYAVCSGMRIGHVCPFGKNLMFISKNEGESWSAPSVINDTWLDDRDAGIASLGNGKLIMSYFNHPVELYQRPFWSKWIENDTDEFSRDMTMGALKSYESFTPEMNHSGSFARLSRDSGMTWEAPVRVPVSSPHGPISAKGGRILWLGKQMYAKPVDEGKLLLMESTDDGKSWEQLAELEYPDGFTKKMLHEPHLAELPDGTLVAAVRCEGPELSPSFTIYTAFSYDGGATWTKLQPTGICGSPPHFTVLSDGSLLLSYGRRAEPFGIRASISRDGGKSFGGEYIIDEAPELKYAGDLGYPSTVELAGGELLTVYYRIVPGDSKPSILYTKWKR